MVDVKIIGHRGSTRKELPRGMLPRTFESKGLHGDSLIFITFLDKTKRIGGARFLSDCVDMRDNGTFFEALQYANDEFVKFRSVIRENIPEITID